MLRVWALRYGSRLRAVLRRRPPSGQALVELALVLPVFLVIVTCAVDAGRLFYSQITIVDAAREAALEAASDPSSWATGQPCDKVTNRVMCRAINESAGSFITIAPADVSMSCTPSCSRMLGNRAVVVVTGHFSTITPFLWPLIGRDLTLTAKADAQITVPPAPNAAPSPSPSPSPSASPTPSPTPSPSTTAGPSASASSSAPASASPTPTPCFAPTASFTVSPASGFAYKNNGHPGTTFAFTDTSTNMSSGCSPVWSWNFGDGAGSSSQKNATYVYQASNSSPGFTVTLVITNSMGTSTASYVLPVSPS